MTLTTILGSSGSGKTMFLSDLYGSWSKECVFIRQNHTMRPNVIVAKIPNFDPQRLPYWETYVAERKQKTIMAGGTMAGEMIHGLSGGQRKLLLFEIVCQRVANKSNLLILFDEPFAGVTDDFIPFICSRLTELKVKHNIVLVTNDHIEKVSAVSDNIIAVSSIDRQTVRINNHCSVLKEKAILLLSAGKSYDGKRRFVASSSFDEFDEDLISVGTDKYVRTHRTDNVDRQTLWNDFQFFCNVEIWRNSFIYSFFAFSIVAFNVFLITFWNSNDDNAALVLIAADVVVFYSLSPYLLTLVDWRIAIDEECDALIHQSRSLNKILKLLLVLALLMIIVGMEFGFVNLVSNNLRNLSLMVAMFFDNIATSTYPLVILGIYTKLPLNTVQNWSSIMYLFTVFFSTAFSPGAGVPYVKALRYLFPRFYFWCMVPDIQDQMEGCPTNENMSMLYLVLSSLLGSVVFGLCILYKSCKQHRQHHRRNRKIEVFRDTQYFRLQKEIYGTSASQSSRQRSSGDGSSITAALTTPGEESSHDGSDIRKVLSSIDAAIQTVVTNRKLSNRKASSDPEQPPDRLYLPSCREDESTIGTECHHQMNCGSSNADDDVEYDWNVTEHIEPSDEQNDVPSFVRSQSPEA